MSADAVVVAARAAGRFDLEFEPAAGCAACAGTCLWKRLAAARLEDIPIDAQFAPGTQVKVELPERRVLLASMLVHGAPLIAILAGSALGFIVTRNDVGTIVGAVAAVGLVVACLRGLRLRLERATLANLIVSARS